MPYKEADATDPMMLVGMEIPTENDTSRATATVFAEEFTRMGFEEAALMSVFQNPYYAGAHRAYRTLGEEAVRSIVREQLNLWGRLRYRVVDTDPVADDKLGSSATESPSPAASREDADSARTHRRDIDG